MRADTPQLQALLGSLMNPGLKAIDLTLQRIESHLAAIGNPHHALPPVVHVAGTNGKGSTIAFLRAILEASGYSCHVFTSPHLVHFRERIAIASRESTDEELVPVLEAIRARGAEYPLTFFEANTVAAFELFTKHPADIVLLEVGMGGRFDATNVIEKPALSIITPISMDHQEYLGDTLAKVAFEKVGILKPGVEAVIAPQAKEAMAVIEEVAAQRATSLHVPGIKQHSSLNLSGGHQQVNASVAVEAAHVLSGCGFSKINERSINNGLREANWPARLQHLKSGDLVDMLPRGWRCVVDGGHNESAGHALAQWIAAQELPVYPVIAMSKEKDAAAFLAALRGATPLYLTEIPEEPLSMSLDRLTCAAQQAGVAYEEANTPCDAIEAIVKKQEYPAVVLICGSLYLAGWVLAKNR